jgi:hypothetical protein
VTDQSNPSAPKVPRRKPRREPATIDLPSTVVKETSAETPPQPSASDEELIREAVAIEMAAPADPAGPFEPAAGDAPPLPPGDSDGERIAMSGEGPAAAGTPRRPSVFLPMLAAALLGGVVGAGLLFALQDLRPPSVDPRIAALEQRVASLPQNGAQTTAVQAMQARIQALEAARTASDDRVAAAQAAAEQALNRPVPAPDAKDEAAIADLTQRLSAIEGQLQTNQQAATEARSALTVQVEDLSKRLSQGSDDATKATVRMVLAQRVAEALRLGTPYAETLSALRANGADAARLSALEPFAEKGAPTAAALARSFEPLSAGILRDDRAPAGRFTDRLLRMADKVVTIRPVDEPGSSDVTSLVARIEQALERGNVQEAVASWEALPEPARRLSDEWAARAKARAAADAGAQAVANDAIAALTRPAP